MCHIEKGLNAIVLIVWVQHVTHKLSKTPPVIPVESGQLKRLREVALAGL